MVIEEDGYQVLEDIDRSDVVESIKEVAQRLRDEPAKARYAKGPIEVLSLAIANLLGEDHYVTEDPYKREVLVNGRQVIETYSTQNSRIYKILLPIIQSEMNYKKQEESRQERHKKLKNIIDKILNALSIKKVK